MRPFTAAAGDQIAARTARLLDSPCRCYDVVHGNAPAFNPLAARSAMRLRRFRDASLHQLPADANPRRAVQLLWAVRQHALRNIENEAALQAGFAADPLLSVALRRVVLESLPLAQQMRLVSTSRGILAVHGQAMAWVLFLPSGRPTAAVEIFPRGLINHIYRDLSHALGVRYESQAAAAARGCGGKGSATKPLACNVSVAVGKVLAAAHRAATWAGGARGDM